MNAEFGLKGKIIETERLLLRPFQKSDLEEFYDYARVEGVGEMAGWPHHKSIAETKKILDSFIQHDKTFAVTLKESGKLIGSLGIEKYGMEDKLTEFDGYCGRELGFVLNKEYWGQGLMPEAVNAVIRYLFHEEQLDFLICGHFVENHQSASVQKKCGFRPYRKLMHDTVMGTQKEGRLNLLINPDHNVVLHFSHLETLIWEKEYF